MRMAFIGFLIFSVNSVFAIEADLYGRVSKHRDDGRAKVRLEMVGFLPDAYFVYRVRGALTEELSRIKISRGEKGHYMNVSTPEPSISRHAPELFKEIPSEFREDTARRMSKVETRTYSVHSFLENVEVRGHVSCYELKKKIVPGLEYYISLSTDCDFYLNLAAQTSDEAKIQNALGQVLISSKKELGL